MATIYTNYTGIYGRLRVDYSYTQNYAANTSLVTLKGYLEGVSGLLVDEELWITLTINGNSVQLPVIAREGTNYVGQYSKTITHNGDGTKSIYIRGYYNSGSVYTNNTLLTLATIPKNANYTEHYIYSRTLNTLTVKWASDVVINWVQYSLNGGAFTDTQEYWTAPDSKSGTYTILNLNPGTNYDIKTSIKRADNELWSESGTISFSTFDIAKVTNANNINDEQNPYMTFTNPSGSSIKAFLEVLSPTQNICLIDNIANIGNYTFNLTQAQKNIIYEKCKNSNSTIIRYGIVTKVNNVDTYWHWIDRTISIVNANPIFNNFTYEDANVATLSLTGDNQKIIKGYSNIHANISNINKAIPQKGASMSKYTLVTGSKPGLDGIYSDTNDVTITINNADGNVASVYAIDSRNNSTKKDIPVQLIDYSPINIKNISAVRDTGGIGTNAILNFDGDIWNNNFGAVQNTIVSAKYRYKKTTDSEWTEGITNIMPVLTENTYSKLVNIAGDLEANGFDKSYSYNIEIEIKDKLSTTLLNNKTILQSAKPQQAFGIGEGVAFGDFYDYNEGGDLQLLKKNILNLMHPIGEIFVSTNSNNPATYLGFGSWVIWGIGRVPVGVDTSQTEFNTVEKTGGHKLLQSHTHIQNPHSHILSRRGAWGEAGHTGMLYEHGANDFENLIAQNTTATNQNTGGGNSENLQPYITCYMFKRTA